MWLSAVGLGNMNLCYSSCCGVAFHADDSMPTQDALVERYSSLKANGHYSFLVFHTKFLP